MQPEAAEGRCPPASAPSPLQECCSCRRRLSADRMCVVVVGAEPLCGLCGHISSVQSAVDISAISASDEEKAMVLLARLHALLVTQR